MRIKVYDRLGSEFESITLHIVNNSVYRAESYHKGEYRNAHEFQGMHPRHADNILVNIASPAYQLVRDMDTD